MKLQAEVELNTEQIKEVVVREMAEIIDCDYSEEDVKNAATRIVQYYLRASEYAEFQEERLYEFRNDIAG